MARTLITIAAVACGVTLVTPAPARAQVADVDTTVRRWLLNTCGVGEGDAPVQELRRHGTAAVPFLLRAFEQGPDVEALDQLTRVADQRFDRRQELLARGTGLGLTTAQLALARQVTRPEYSAQVRADFVHQYRSEAVRALAVVGGADAIELLQRVASDADSPFRAAAQAALTTLRSPG